MSKTLGNIMAQTRRFHSDTFKFKVALEAASGNIAVADLCNKYGVASGQISKWKKQLMNNGPKVFGNKKVDEVQERQIADLERSLGKITAENHFLARVLGR